MLYTRVFRQQSIVCREYTLENDPTCLYQVAQAIIHLQKFYGPIPKIWGKGSAAKQVWDLVQRLQRGSDTTEKDKESQNACIDQVLLIDRSVDLISPLATQLTYEGLIDEIFGLNNGTAKLPSEKFLSSEEQQTESLKEAKKLVILNSGDKLFADVRDKNFNAVNLNRCCFSELVLNFCVLVWLGWGVFVEAGEDCLGKFKVRRQAGYDCARDEAVRSTFAANYIGKKGFVIAHDDRRVY